MSETQPEPADDVVEGPFPAPEGDPKGDLP